MSGAAVIGVRRSAAAPGVPTGGRARAIAARLPAGSFPALIALYLCWGSSVPAIKVMVGSVPPLAGAGGVFFLGGLALAALARPRLGELRPTEAKRAAAAGTLLLVGGQGLATVVLTQLTASLTAVLIATIPLVIAAMNALGGTRVSRASALRLAVGFAGVVIVVVTAPAAAIGGSVAGLVLLGVAVLCWTSGSVIASRGATPADARVNGAIQLLAGGAVLLVGAAVAGQLDPSAWAHVTGSSLVAMVWLLAFDSVAGFLLYAHLLRTAPIELVSTYAYATPVVAAVLGFVALGEPIWIGVLLGAPVILVAVVGQLQASRG